ncbi:MAG TPA: carboxypeptidase-like regulatory domain-containing protein [Acidobacteriaceae bacterium]|nr:carboxypeptidase-like regulatory domain-containing protein [Acidobacteriaceae bacterium]
MRKLLCSTIFLFSLIFSAARPAAAQGVLAEIRGTVRDNSGLVVPSAPVTVLDTTKGWTRKTTTNESGQYQFSELPTDNFTVSVEAPSFQKDVRQGILLQTGQQAQIDFTLTPGEVSETVTVVENASQVQTDDATLGTVIDTRKILELPLNGRVFWQLAQLVPNAYPPIHNSSLSFRGGFNVAGQPEVNNNYLLDGIDNSDAATMQPVVSPSVDGIHEFKVLTGVYDAEYGRFSGGQILITTKSGGNKIHGSAYEFYRTSALDAKNYFSPGTLPSFTRNQYGGTAGGPIAKDRAFYFGTYEGLRLTQQISSLATVPTLQDRTGNLSDLVSSSGRPIVVLNPATGKPFPGNQLPALDPVSQQLLSYYPQPTYAGTANNYLFSETRTQQGDQFSVRVDDTLWTNNTAFVSYQYQEMNAFEPSNALCGSSVLPGFGCTTPELDQAISLHDTQIFSSSLINEARVGFNRIRTNRFLQDASYGDVLSKLGIPTTGANGVGEQSGENMGVPSVTISGYSTLGGATNLPQGRRDNTYNVVDSLSWIKGNHSFKFGGDFKRFMYNLGFYQDGRGVFAFNGQYTTNALADFLLGDLLSTARDPGNPGVHSFTNSADFFAQDEWQLTPRFTLNYGLRYEINFPEGEKNNRISSFDPATGLVPVANGELLNIDPTTGELVNVGVSPLTGSIWHLDKTNVAPRIGFAYQPFGNQKTVFRGGYGIFYNQLVAGNGISQMWRGIPFRTRQTFLNRNSSSYPKPALTATWTNPFPSGVTNAGGYTPNGINANYATAANQEWSLSVDRDLQRDLTLELTYLGSHGTHLQESYNINQPPPGPGAIQPRRPYNQWGGITWIDSNGFGHFNSFAAQLTRRYSQGMTLLSSYTYAHSLDDAPYSGAAIQNPRDLAASYGSSDFDVRHRLVTSFTYELPFGTDKPYGSNLNSIAKGFISGWQVNGIFVYQTGNPFTVTTSKDMSNTGASSTGTYANRLPGADIQVAHPGPAKWFNTAAFSDVLPAGTYAFGNSGRNILTADGTVDFDFGLYRRVQTTESTQLELRAELYNSMNHPDFTAPSANLEASSFGRITSTTSTSRETQFAVKFLF